MIIRMFFSWHKSVKFKMIIFYLASYTIIIIYYFLLDHQAITPIIEAPSLLVTFDLLLNFPMIGMYMYITCLERIGCPERTFVVLKNLLTAARAFSFR